MTKETLKYDQELGVSDTIITKEQLKTLLEGLMVWNTIILDSLTDAGRKKLYKAQDLITNLYMEND